MSKREWLRGVTDELPDNFDWGNIRSINDVNKLLKPLWRPARALAAHAIYEQRGRLFDDDLIYAAIMEVWRGDAQHHELICAFGSRIALADALGSVAPPVHRRRRLTCYRGVSVEDGTIPAETALGMSWTRDRAIACWFATKFDGRPTGCPFVFRVTVEANAIIAFENAREEREVLLRPSRLNASSIYIEGTSNISCEAFDARAVSV